MSKYGCLLNLSSVYAIMIADLAVEFVEKMILEG